MKQIHIHLTFADWQKKKKKKTSYVKKDQEEKLIQTLIFPKCSWGFEKKKNYVMQKALIVYDLLLPIKQVRIDSYDFWVILI